MTDARRWGVQEQYFDTAGHTVVADPDVVQQVLDELRDGRDEPPPPAALVVHAGADIGRRIDIVTEDGREMTIDGTVTDGLPLGYHSITGGADGSGPERVLICSPRRCHLPPGLRLGGWALQLYAMRSAGSWGIGDLADLRQFGRWAAARGNGFALINPLSASAPAAPVEASPYLPTSRRFRNPLYLRVEDVPGAGAIAAELEVIARAGRALNAERLIDRDTVTRLKLDALTLIHAATTPSAAFTSWRRTQGDALERFSAFCALAEEHGGDWRRWPAALQDPSATATRREVRRLGVRIGFFAWLQWLVEVQLGSASEALPLMQDLPIGVDPGGADVWADRQLFANGFSVGAPPDIFNPGGQDWAQPPFHPWRLRAAGYAPLIAILRAALHSSAALRIDHVMGLFRLYWIPRGGAPSSGVFVRYPADDILDILALESVRAGAWVVGEDLGTVEPAVREQMAARDILSYRLLWFEDGPPAALPERAMSAITTHDLPTVVGLWSGSDLRAQRAVGLAADDAAVAEIQGRLGRVVGDAWHAPAADVVVAAYQALARSPSKLVAASLDDAAEVAERPNMPGTRGDTWPNWRLALPSPLDELLSSPLAERLANVLRRD